MCRLGKAFTLAEAVGRLYQADRKINSRVSKHENVILNLFDYFFHNLRFCEKCPVFPLHLKKIPPTLTLPLKGGREELVSAAHRKFLVPYCLSNLVSSKKAAFTLAEVLITLGIIGIVAAMTIPTLVANYQKKVLKTQFTKKYAEISQAVLLAKSETNGNFKSHCTLLKTIDADAGKYEYSNKEECFAIFNKYFKQVGTCEYKNDVVTYNKENTAYTDIGSKANPGKLLADGSCYDMVINGGNLGFTFDMNGPDKGPNALGHDIFSFHMDKNDYLQPLKQSSIYSDDERENAITECEEKYPSGGQHYSSCIASAEQKGYPCRKDSSQAGNGIGCSWYAAHDECPEDNTKGYWDCLPK